MLKFLLLAITTIILFPGYAIAQDLHRHSLPSIPHFRRMTTNVNYQGLMFVEENAKKTTAADVRLKSQGVLGYDGSSFLQTDSVNYSYSGTMGGYFDTWEDSWKWKYDEIKFFIYNGTGYDPAHEKITQTFDASDKVTSMSLQDWNTTSSSWDNVYHNFFSYDASGRVASEISQTWNTSTAAWENTIKATYTYTTSGKVATYLWEGWNSPTAAWVNRHIYTNTYDASDNVISSLYELWAGATPSWENSHRYTYTYNASGNRLTELDESWDASVPGWVNYSRKDFSDFVGYHQPKKIIYMDWNSSTSTYDNSSKEEYTYNSYDKPDYYEEQDWNSTTSSWEATTSNRAIRFHYEPVTATGFSDIKSIETSALSVFPVPASNNTTISVHWDVAQPFSMSITDMQGRALVSWNMPAMRDYTENISLDDLSAGSYIVTLHGKSGTVSKQLSVVK